MQSFFAFLFFLIVGGVIYAIKKYYVTTVKETVEQFDKDLNRYVLIHNINHITETHEGKKVFHFDNRDNRTFQEVIPDKLVIVDKYEDERVEYTPSLMYNPKYLENRSIRELKNLTYGKLRNDTTIVIYITKESIKDKLI